MRSSLARRRSSSSRLRANAAARWLRLRISSAGGQQDDQPGCERERERGGGVAVLADQPGPHGGGVADDQRGDRGGPLLREDRGEERHDQREIDRMPVFAARPQRRGQGDGQDADRIAAAGQQRRAAHREQDVGQGPGPGLARWP
jgi:hypothetical protein